MWYEGCFHSSKAIDISDGVVGREPAIHVGKSCFNARFTCHGMF